MRCWPGRCPPTTCLSGLRWTPADVPLLDEAAELLGDDGAEAAAREAAALREEVMYAQGVLDVLDLEEDLDPELLRATDVIDADRLAERQAVRRYDSTADRAAADREWTYGHVIVDEAQELSAMAWRLVDAPVPHAVDDAGRRHRADRRPRGRLVVGRGAVAVRGEPVAAGRAHGQLPHARGDRRGGRRPAGRDRARPGAAAVGAHRPGVPPRAVAVVAGALDEEVAKITAEEAGAVGEGRTAVLAPAARVAGLRDRLMGAVTPGPDTPDGPADPEVDLTSPVVVLPIGKAKGLEFDAVVLVEPAEVLAESPRGANDLYVALTRATQRLAVVHAEPLPEVLHRLTAG